LSSSNVDHVNRRLAEVLEHLDAEIASGVIVSVEDTSLRIRSLPVE
jgi:hypothetical protein